jgi:hypothetical protein
MDWSEFWTVIAQIIVAFGVGAALVAIGAAIVIGIAREVRK